MGQPTTRRIPRKGPAKPLSYRKIDFDRELEYGWRAYHRVVGQWWSQQSADRSHAYAYRKIADYVRDLPLSRRRRIVDYACGTGSLLTRLYRRVPDSEIIGIDGSPNLMSVAMQRLRRIDRGAPDRIRFIKTKLPDFSLPRGMADLVIFAFPHIVAVQADQPYYDKHGYRNREDAALARVLAESREPDPEEETTTAAPDDLFDSLMSDRVVSRNLHRIVKKGGLCLRIDYANSERDELTELVWARTAFEEGSMDRPFKGRSAEFFFDLVRSNYYRSRVIEDVYHQTRDKTDQEGGYTITLLRAL